MKKSELKKILLEKKEKVLKKKKTIMEYNNKYDDLFEKDIERLKVSLFNSFCEKYYLENKYDTYKDKKIKVKYYCYYSGKYKENNPFFVFEIHDIKHNKVFYVSEKYLESLKEDKMFSNVKCKYKRNDCFDSTLKGEAVSIKFIISKENFEKVIKDLTDDDSKVKNLKK